MTAFNFRYLPTAAAAAMLLATSAASAQASVQLYGIVDAGVTRVSGLAAGSQTQLASGIMEGSRWGLRGNEDLGGGYRAIFTLESRFELDTGSLSSTPISGTQLPASISSTTALGLLSTPQLNAAVAGINSNLGQSLGVNVGNARLFDRQAFLGLVTPFGAILAGRQYTPAFEVNATFDSMNTQSGLSAGQIASFPPSLDIRLNNTLQYRIQKDGLTANLMYGFGEADTATTSGVNRFYGFMAMYKGDGYSVGVAYNTRKNDVGQKSLTNTALGASMQVGPGTVSTLYLTNKDNNPSVNSIRSNTTQFGAAAGLLADAYSNALKQDGRLFHIGYKIPFGASTVTVSYNTFNDKRASNADVKSYGVAYTYALSKRTDLNAVLVRVDNGSNGQAAAGGNGYLGGFTRAPGVDSTSIAFGVRHRF